MNSGPLSWVGAANQIANSTNNYPPTEYMLIYLIVSVESEVTGTAEFAADAVSYGV